MAQLPAKPTEHTSAMKSLVNNASLMARVERMLGKSSGTFLSSVLDLYTSDGYLNKCDPNAVMAEALKAASLSLPVTKALGFAYIVPYGTTPTFVLGYRGMVQLALRTGKYRTINTGCVYEGENMVTNRITGDISISGAATSDKVIGYFAYMELTNGFNKVVGMTVDEVRKHAAKKSKSYNVKGSAWQTDFDAMAQKTVLRRLLSRYGVMSVEYVAGVMQDADDIIEAQIADTANSEPLVLPDEQTQALEAAPEEITINSQPEPMAAETVSHAEPDEDIGFPAEPEF